MNPKKLHFRKKDLVAFLRKFIETVSGNYKKALTELLHWAKTHPDNFVREISIDVVLMRYIIVEANRQLILNSIKEGCENFYLYEKDADFLTVEEALKRLEEMGIVDSEDASTTISELKNTEPIDSKYASIAISEWAKVRTDKRAPVSEYDKGYYYGVVAGYKRCLEDDADRMDLEERSQELGETLSNLQMLSNIVIESGLMKYAPPVRDGLTFNMRVAFAISKVLEIVNQNKEQ